MILINANFLCRNLTGIERFSFEICKRLDSMVTKEDEIFMLVPANARIVPEYSNIKIIKSKKAIKGFPKWDIIDFPAECRKLKATPLNFSNTAPLCKNTGYAFIHDIYAYDHPEDFKSFRDRLITVYSKLHYRNIARHAKKVITVSNFSKKHIQDAYRTPEARITVIGNGWDHFNDIKSDEGIFEKLPAIEKTKYYFTLGSLSKRKNLVWIARYAQKHSESTFVVSGKAIGGLVPPELEMLKKLPNVILAGYVSDEEVKALMTYCRAFIFPSYYEGFGIPPLEALSCGSEVICSSSSCLPEIYEDTVHYIDPDDTDVNLDELIQQKTADSKKVLSKYTYDNAASALYALLKE